MIRDFETGALKAFNFDDLLHQIPELKLLDCSIETVGFDTPIDSSNMKPSYWIDLVDIIETNYDFFDGFVVLHGSDTMSYTASAVSFMLENLTKPVIFTGSQLPIGDLRTDAKENLITSIQVAALRDRKGNPMVQEVALYFEYKLYRANRTTKINAEHFQAFASLNYPPIGESGVNLSIDDKFLWKPKSKGPFKVYRNLVSEILLIKMFPGIQADILDNMLSYSSLKGVVMETFGAGNITNETWMVALLEKTIKRGVPIVNVTQCSGGRVTMGLYETSIALKRIGVISGNDLTTEAALAKMMFLLGEGYSGKNFKLQFETSLRGELSEN